MKEKVHPRWNSCNVELKPASKEEQEKATKRMVDVMKENCEKFKDESKKQNKE